MDAALLSPPRRLRVPIDNRWGAGEMAVLDFGDPARPVDLIFVHANGFNAATYRCLLSPLASSLRIWAPDLRGHGRSSLPIFAQPKTNWRDHRDDLLGLLAKLDGPPAVLAGHSMGGTASLLAAAVAPSRVSSLVLFDPVIWKRSSTLMFNLPLAARLLAGAPISRAALRRRRLFDSREQALAAYRGRGVFKGWPDAVLADYLSDGLTETPDGLSLSAAPEWEAANYAAQAHDPWRALRRYGGPVRILKAERGALTSLSPHPRGLPNVTVEVVPGGGHLFPMTHPDVARDALFEAAV
ncbi:alpha/beta fold hydrolase [Brevundimonas sp. SORGH_AS_0993]|uniref:alpha/beta fold hydrolase n=1 Tax=Brevundimonas sp. SORGH_AS_0993 TaxID=3041794 RepID=UPI002788B2F2|nr:alpha/beta hydrolase [Brevundimonas sp. SORGH_AS_0993]MDQ1154586.1 pimeloyl-ACP methyl ester carboxylesterase [Brevundimonas sp. SORGH_AS_0993]